jgi:hypothetical protein
MIDTIIKVSTSEKSSIRTQVHSIDNASVREIFVILNNFAVDYLDLEEIRQAFVLLQCAIQISKHEPHLMEK